MSRETGRNDSCPCGSGKKYKHCCLRKERARPHRTQRRPDPPVLGETTDRHHVREPLAGPSACPNDPQDAPAEQRWDEFREAAYPERIDLFDRVLNDGFEHEDLLLAMIHELFHDVVRRQDHPRFVRLLDRLRQHCPHAYEHAKPGYLHLLFRNAVAAEDLAAAGSVALQLAPLGHRSPDRFFAVLDCLAYHGKLATLIAVLRAGWPALRDSEQVAPWHKQRWLALALRCEFYDSMQTTPDSDGRDPALWDRFDTHYAPYDHELAADISGSLSRCDTVQRTTQHSPAVFPVKGGDESARRERKGLLPLLDEFLLYAIHAEAVPCSKADLARSATEDWLGLRSPEQLARLQQRGDGRVEGTELWKTVLHPDYRSVDTYLTQVMFVVAPRYYRGAAFFESIPTWLRFLQRKGLVSAEVKHTILGDLQPLLTRLREHWAPYKHDPSLVRGLAQWGEETGHPAEEVEI